MISELPASIVKPVFQPTLSTPSWLPLIVRTPPPLSVCAPVIVTSLYDSRSIVPAPTPKATLLSVRSLPESVVFAVALVTWILPPAPVVNAPASVALPRPVPAGVLTVMSIALAVPLVVTSEAPLLIVKLPLPEPSLSALMSIKPLPASTDPLRDTLPVALKCASPPLVLIVSSTLMSAAVTLRLPPPVFVAVVWKLTVSSPSALIVKSALKAASSPMTSIVSAPLPPSVLVSIRSEVVGFTNVTDSPSVESMNEYPGMPTASDSVIVSTPPGNANTRLFALLLSTIGSRPR